MQEIVDKKKTKSTRSLSKRLEALEAEVAELKQIVQQQVTKPVSGNQPFQHDWEHTFGIFKDDPTHDESIRLGREWRERQR